MVVSAPEERGGVSRPGRIETHMCREVLVEPVDPELLQPDAPAQHEVLVELVLRQPRGLRVVALRQLLVVRESGPVVGHRVTDRGEHRLPVAVRRAAQLHGQRTAERLGGGRLGQPVGQHPLAGRRHGVHLLVGPAGLRDRLDAHPAVGVHPGEHPVDLLVRGVPEVADRLLEPPREVEPGRGLFAQGDEEGVFEGHGRECGTPMQLVASPQRSCSWRLVSASMMSSSFSSSVSESQ